MKIKDIDPIILIPIGAVVFFVVLITWAIVSEMEATNECESKGGMYMSAHDICVDPKGIIPMKRRFR